MQPRSFLSAAGVRCAALLMSAAAALPVAAQGEFPNRTIRLITPAAPGGTTDILSRLVAAKLTETMGQQVIVDNRASASGVNAGEITARAAPDGYTLLLVYHQHTINAALNAKLPYHPVNDFTPISQLTSAGLFLVVNPSTPAKTPKEFLDWTRSLKGSINFGSAGIGSGGHLAGELYNLMAGIKAQHIPYKGSGPALADLVGGQYHYNFAGMQAAQALVRAGRLRGIAVSNPKRIAAMADVPAMAEVLPGFELVGWYGIAGPAKMPKPLVSRLNTELLKFLAMPDVRERILADGSEPVGNDPETFRKYMLADMIKWAKLVKESGAKL
ncbi:MAG: tripartite tricarboxylate transporter substrate binding protein [Proteobacteria bacterium]|nr:tripartite tricarboxylate transporter substrate binding protein [Pseudomonadota bacterium]